MSTCAEEAGSSLAHMGADSMRLFSSSITALATLDSRTIDASRAAIYNEEQRFTLWARNLGLTRPAHKGLDYRLQNAPSLRKTVYAFLEDLNESLVEVVKLLSRHTQADEHGFHRVEEQSFNGDSEVKVSINTQLDRPENETDSEETNTLESALEDLAGDISDIVEKLYEIAFIIRSPAVRTGHAKRDLSKYFDAVTISSLEAIESRRLHDQIRQSRGNDPKRLSEYANRNPAHPSDYDEVMIQRLARANTQRRQQFIYWRRREASQRQPIPDAKQVTMPASDPRPGTQRLMNESSPSQVYSRDTKAPPISYTVSRVDGNLLADRPEPSIATRTPTAYGISGEKVEWPPPPDGSGEGWFECPYCFELCPGHYRKQDEWKAHLTHDILPYICTYVPCTEGSQLFANRREWINHERTAHKAIWRCAKHPPLEFADRNSYVSHMKEEHSADLAASYSLSPEIIDAHISVSINPDRDCPFCYAGLETTEDMENHLAFHLESIALFTLPKNDPIEEGKSGESASLVKQGMAMARDSRKSDFDHLSLSFEENEDKLSLRAPAAQSQTLTSENLQSYTASLPAMGYMDIVESFRQQLTLDSPPDKLSSLSTDPYSTTGSELDHWAKRFFVEDMSTTPLPPTSDASKCFGEHMPEARAQLNGWEELLELEFGNISGRLVVRLYLREDDNRARILCKWLSRFGRPCYSCLPLNNLNIRRNGSSLLLYRRILDSDKDEIWARLKFLTMERLVVFYCTLLALRSQDDGKPVEDIQDHELEGEQEIFAGQIIDDDFLHALRIYRDQASKAVRLQASVLHGKMKRTLVWTAFITNYLHSPLWLTRAGPDKVHLNELRRFIFSSEYLPELTRHGEHILKFISDHDAEDFVRAIRDVARLERRY